MVLQFANIVLSVAYKGAIMRLWIAQKIMSEKKKTMSYVEKTTSDIGKIISDLFFAPCNTQKNKPIMRREIKWLEEDGNRTEKFIFANKILIK